MYHDQRQWPCVILSAISLPVTPATDLDARSDFDETLLWRRQMNSAREKETCNCLDMPASQPTPNAKRFSYSPITVGWQLMRAMILRSKTIAGSVVDLRTRHKVILTDEIYGYTRRVMCWLWKQPYVVLRLFVAFGFAQSTHDLGNIVLLKEANTGNTRRTGVEARVRVGESDSTKGQYWNRIAASLLKCFKPRGLRRLLRDLSARNFLLKDWSENSKSCALNQCLSYFGIRMTGDSDHRLAI
jgi:hypothetical protein